MKHGPLLLVLSLLMLSGCTPSPVLKGATLLGSTTSAAVNAQQSEFAKYRADKAEEEQSLYATRRTALGLSNECAAAIAAEKPIETVKLCRVIPKEPLRDFVPAYEPTTFPKLAAALNRYAQALSVLSGDFTDEEGKLAAALVGIGASIKSLDRVLAESNGESAGSLDPKQVDAITAVLTAGANAAFQAQRDYALTQLVQKSDPLVQEAVIILSAAMVEIKTLRTAVAFQVLNDAVSAHDDARKTLRGAKLRKVNDSIYEKLTAYKVSVAIVDPFPAIGEAHAELVKLTKTGFWPVGRKRFMKHVIAIVESVAVVAEVSS